MTLCLLSYYSLITLTFLFSPGVKFFVIVDKKQTGCDNLLHRIYELYTDYVLKNPFYPIDMPIRCELFDQNLRKVIEQVERTTAYNSERLS